MPYLRYFPTARGEFFHHIDFSEDLWYIANEKIG